MLDAQIKVGSHQSALASKDTFHGVTKKSSEEDAMCSFCVRPKQDGGNGRQQQAAEFRLGFLIEDSSHEHQS